MKLYFGAWRPKTGQSPHNTPYFRAFWRFYMLARIMLQGNPIINFALKINAACAFKLASNTKPVIIAGTKF